MTLCLTSLRRLQNNSHWRLQNESHVVSLQLCKIASLQCTPGWTNTVPRTVKHTVSVETAGVMYCDSLILHIYYPKAPWFHTKLYWTSCFRKKVYFQAWYFCQDPWTAWTAWTSGQIIQKCSLQADAIKWCWNNVGLVLFLLRSCCIKTWSHGW